MTKRRVPDITDEEEVQIQRWIAEDPDDWEATDEELANPMSFEEAAPELAASVRRERPDLAETMRRTIEKLRRRRGRPQVLNPKLAVTLRLDPETVDRFKAQGPDWRARMSEVLKRASKT